MKIGQSIPKLIANSGKSDKFKVIIKFIPDVELSQFLAQVTFSSFLIKMQLKVE